MPVDRDAALHDLQGTRIVAEDGGNEVTWEGNRPHEVLVMMMG
jgi:hypothetical protein